MRRILSTILLAFTITAASGAAQEIDSISLASRSRSAFEYRQPAFIKSRGHQIKNIVPFDDRSGFAYTADTLFRTDDGGETWREVPVLGKRGKTIASVIFTGRLNGAVLIAGDNYYFELASTSDGGINWTRRQAVLENAAFYEIVSEDASLTAGPAGSLEISARIPTSSNFTGRAVYRSDNGGDTWHFVSRSIDLNEDAPVSAIRRNGSWSLETSGSCAYYKSGCAQETALSISGREATPPALKDLARQAKEDARREGPTGQRFAAAPPGGSTRISLNRGFDKCQAGSVAQMQLWWDNSYFFDSNIYFSGRARACPSQPFTGNPAWIDQVTAMGWGLIPTVVGYQSPCSVSSTIHKHSSDPTTAEQQGRGEADIAASDATAIGLTAGSVLYYDMEQYNVPSPDTGGCRAATIAFLKGWTDRIKELGYKSGVYGSPRNAQEDWVTLPAASRMDAIWMARWDNIPSVWTYGLFPNFPTNFWNNHQRIKQWQSPHNETWGGVTFDIDGNIADGPVAGIPFARNKPADFDGDGKTDISVFRPSTGEWYISGTRGPSYNFYQFGEAADLLTPGDYDGDGRTDFAVFRPSTSTWYFRAKGTYSFRQYGETGDIPAAADYDGNGRTDIALFRPSTGVWYFAYNDSLNTFGQVQFGVSGDRPAAADYDGDGKADIAVWRPSDGNWYVQGSAGAYTVVTWGVASDIPAQGDYDGDGKTDRAVFRPSEGTWYLMQSSEGFRVQQFGVAGDLPATGDYDGDGRYDIAVFRPSENTWYLSLSTGIYSVRQFGAADDKPIPAAYLPR